MNLKKSLLAATMFAIAAAFADGAASVKSVTVATKAPHNQEATFWYHVPAKYDAKRKKPYPVLVYFGGRNCKGKDEASGKLGWSDWADANGAFLVCPGFRNDTLLVKEKDEIEIEVRNPLYTRRLAELWQR